MSKTSFWTLPWNKSKTTPEPENKANKQLTVVADLLRQNFDRYRKELNQWRDARDLRLDVLNPVTYWMQEIYADVMIDAHLRALVENRILRIANREFVIRNADGEIDQDKSKLINAPWFTDVVRYVMESVFYGYNLIYIEDAEPGKIKSVKCVPREHVIPEKKIIVHNVSEYENGFPYEEMSQFFMYAQMYDAIGLLEVAAPMTVLKRHSWGSWDEFEQLFGIPIRVAKIMNYGNHKKKMETAKWLEEMGKAAGGVFEYGDEIEVVSSNQTDAYKVFFEKIASVNSELSKLVNGQTMTTDNGSSRSQADVHLKTQNEITRADEREMLFWLNNTLLPVLRSHGYPIAEEETIAIFKQDAPEDRIKIDIPLMQNGFKPTREYIEKTYGIELDEVSEDPKPDPKKKKTDKEVEDFFG